LALDTNRKDILIILEALSANAGSALTPFGNPQNLFIYWFYDLHPIDFISTIAPFSLVFLAILMAASCLIDIKINKSDHRGAIGTTKTAFIYIALLIIVILTVLHLLPVATGFIVVAYAVVFDRRILKVDYALLLSFLLFFGLAENLKLLIAGDLNHSHHIFLASAITSQIMSNVPASLLFAKFTSNWEALLWGTNVGGFGGLFGSLANLIAYKFYTTDKNTTDTAAFTLKFLLFGYGAFFVAIGLYFLLYGMIG